MPDKFRGLGIFLDTYANARHGYAFPRIVSMLGDGKTSYDHADDGEKTKIGACSANFRRTNVATKVRITYIKEGYLKVQIQYKACKYFNSCDDGRGLIIGVLKGTIGLTASRLRELNCLRHRTLDSRP